MIKPALPLVVLLAIAAAFFALTRVEPAPSAGAAPCKSCLLPSADRGAVFVISGHGWGHGVGMPQYGAYGYATRGASFARILAHYYPGTQLGVANVAKVRVLLASGARSLTISSAAPFRVQVAGGRAFSLPAGPVRLGPRLKLKVGSNDSPKALRGPLVFWPGKQPLELRNPYRGAIEVDSVAGRLRAINVVDLDAYLLGVVPREMPYYWPAEALKAQAVVARSYALTHRRGGAFDLYPDVRSQVYGGLTAERDSASAAVRATTGKVLMYGGRVAETFFYSSSGGRTATVTDVWPGAKPLPYLVSVRDPYDVVSPYHDWGPLVYSAARLGRTLHASGQLQDVRIVRNGSGRVNLLTALASGGRRDLEGNGARRTLGLRSTFFTVGVLSLGAASPVPVTYGSPATLRGVARGLRGLVLQRRLEGETWTAVKTVKPAPDGSFAVTDKPASAAEYRVGSVTVATAPVTVRVAPLIRVEQSLDGTALTGTVRPILGDARVVVERLQQQRWRRVATTALNLDGEFTARFAVTPGMYRARIAARGGLAAGVSEPLRVSGA